MIATFRQKAGSWSPVESFARFSKIAKKKKKCLYHLFNTVYKLVHFKSVTLEKKKHYDSASESKNYKSIQNLVFCTVIIQCLLASLCTARPDAIPWAGGISAPAKSSETLGSSIQQAGGTPPPLKSWESRQHSIHWAGIPPTSPNHKEPASPGQPSALQSQLN